MEQLPSQKRAKPKSLKSRKLKKEFYVEQHRFIAQSFKSVARKSIPCIYRTFGNCFHGYLHTAFFVLFTK